MRKIEVNGKIGLLTEEELAGIVQRFSIENFVLTNGIYRNAVPCSVCASCDGKCDTCKTTVYGKLKCLATLKNVVPNIGSICAVHPNEIWFKESDLVVATQALTAIKNWFINSPEV